MDFCKLLHTAQKNDQTSAGGVRYYSTRFEPPKKLQKNTKEVSINVKKFLEKKEAEEKKRAEEAQRKKEELLALRAQDKKATRRVNVMLKRTKSANQAVIEDAVDKQHTAVTRAGTEQPDEDDYGYVSQEASAFYEKMMEKYKDMPEEPKFKLFKKKVSTNLNGTKDRVKAALEKERDEAMHPQRRKRKRKENEGHEEDGGNDEQIAEMEFHTETVNKSKPKSKPVPPPMSFTDLLKIAEKKQFEPIVVEQKPKEEEKLLTKKQKKEAEREREWRERREGKVPSVLEKALLNKKQVIEKTRSEKPHAKTLSDSEKMLKSQNLKVTSENRPVAKPNDGVKKQQTLNNKTMKAIIQLEAQGSSATSGKKVSVKSNNISKEINTKKTTRPLSDKGKVESKLFSQKPQANYIKSIATGNLKPNESSTKGLLPKKSRPTENHSKPILPKDDKLTRLPPHVKQIDLLNKKKQLIPPSKRRIIDDDEEEYDSELDDFIDDGPEGEENYSSYIKEIFGYDKSKYRGIDDDVDNMESSFAQQMREEIKSAKIGIFEDLEDIKKEKEEKRRKALMKKKLKQR
ncbi:protein SPT2 homolog [Cylas formicarius]|uniref:protein SPT2 homolog n=1 Tax=Cylas formicarius TaxID=197179 RepID=UPI00295896BB|nr:protein SPT2 homolog [Cylas formicarius]XP_060531452.1 protein SPT2 homolog [Cylas formicarius]